MPETTDQPAYTRADPLISQFRKGDKGRIGLGKGGRRSKDQAANRNFFQRLTGRFVEQASDQAGRLLSNVQLDAIRFRLMRAGFPNGMRASNFALLKWVAMVLFSGLLFLMLPIYFDLFHWDVTPAWNFFSILFGAFLGFKMPDLWLNSIIKKRQTEIQLALPDMIDLITVSVEAGLGLAAAIQRVAARFPNVLSEEFTRSMQEVHLGRSQPEALRDMARRIDVPDLTTFLTSLVQAELLGLSIANVLRVQSERLREKRSQRAREQAQKAPIKMIFPLVLFIFPALFVVILGPAMIAIMSQNQF